MGQDEKKSKYFFHSDFFFFVKPQDVVVAPGTPLYLGA
jgi:hypothetical protein